MSAERKPVIKKLSSGTLDLKFMKKSKEKAKVEEEDTERKNLYKDQLAQLHSSSDKVIIINSHYDVMTYLPCRLSFGGHDVDIEKLNSDTLTGLYEIVKEEKDETEKEVDVTAEQMAKHYSSYYDKNLGKKYKFRPNKNPGNNFKNNKRKTDKNSGHDSRIKTENHNISDKNDMVFGNERKKFKHESNKGNNINKFKDGSNYNNDRKKVKREFMKPHE